MTAAELLPLLDATRLHNPDDEAAIGQWLRQIQPLPLAAVCLYPQYLGLAQAAGVELPLATVVNFPHGSDAAEAVAAQTAAALQQGANEIDMVFPYSSFCQGDRAAARHLLDSVAGLCRAHQAVLKVILETGVWQDRQALRAAAALAIDCGADFLKTSTGKTAVGATAEAVALLCEVIRDKQAQGRVGIKLSGGINSLEQVQEYLSIISGYFGTAWLRADKLRIGSSRLIDVIIADTRAQAQAWLAQDPDPETAAQLQTWLEQDAQGQLCRGFAGRLQFGTAGLRGPMRAGSSGMNRVAVAQTARGLADYLLKQSAAPSVVIGYDGRQHSRQFAQDSAEILEGAGVRSYLLPQALPTPVLAYALRALNSSAGIMVTASHNPPQDNGYKVYLGGKDGGAQIVPPVDAAIAACIATAACQDIRTYPRSSAYERLDGEIHEQYCRLTAKAGRALGAHLDYVYTAMHGVGTDTFLRCLQLADYPSPHLVAAQCRPDGDFPTVIFPNPEEPGALDLAIEMATQRGINMVLAHDPDADRLAVALCEKGLWRRLEGNTVGYWLAWEAAQTALAEGRTGCLASSLVSGPLLPRIAAAYDLEYQQTLTGFKWIGRVQQLIFGYEEALGYLVDADKVHDKDGISAAMAFLSLAIKLKTQGRSFADYAATFERQFGAYASGQVSIRKADSSAITNLMQALRAAPPQMLAGLAVEEYLDYREQSPSADVLSLRLRKETAQARILFRPSGTEPKLKIYLDTLAPTQSAAQALLEQLRQALVADYQQSD